jgi:hypothetical protein
MKKDYYSSYRDELLARRDRIRSLTKQSKVQGDYHEALIRELVREQVPEKYKVGHGLVYEKTSGKRSHECDVLVYGTETRPLFEFKSQDLVIAKPDSVKFVIQVKSKLTSKTLKDAINNLRSVKTMSSQIMCGVVGFETDVLLKTLYFNAWKSKAVQFLCVFKSERVKENRELLENQMKYFIEILRYYGKSSLYSNTPHLVISIDENTSEFIALKDDDSEERVMSILSKIHSQGISSLSHP